MNTQPISTQDTPAMDGAPKVDPQGKDRPAPLSSSVVVCVDLRLYHAAKFMLKVRGLRFDPASVDDMINTILYAAIKRECPAALEPYDHLQRAGITAADPSPAVPPAPIPGSQPVAPL